MLQLSFDQIVYQELLALAQRLFPDRDPQTVLGYALDSLERKLYGEPPDTSDDLINDEALIRGITHP